ncbi:uncharacterized protein LOC124934538 [Impatiens glandulifera]|uniref:uncharacterized protein LOC124934538 n=1 Tax=Impatiens glandulifera TaxID=253017 RepID=UPI001FB11591|nr:uncharacterized protein LOC124934538 [Impatiens glandulifera]
MEEAFPNPLERTVAAALLLLSTSAPSLSTPTSKNNYSFPSYLRFELSSPRSCSSSVISDECFSSAEIQKHPLHGANFKVVKRSRSKTHSEKTIFLGSDSAISVQSISKSMTEVSSCLSSSSSGDIRGDSKKTKQTANSSLMRQRAESIMRLISLSATSEVRIRQLLGDSPDTSKALRMLLKLDKISRSGAGGRGDPYIYTI